MKYEEIHNAKEAIKTMTYGLQFIKDEGRKDKQVNIINTFIVLVNAAEKLADRSSDRDLVDVLLLKWFEGEYMKLQNDGTDGFVDVKTLNALRSSFGLSIKLGREGILKNLAMEMAVDELNNSENLSTDDKEVSLTKDERLLKYVDVCSNHWMGELRKFLEYCHSQRVVA